MQIQSNNHYESGRHTQYRPPEPKMKILKRPQSSPGNLHLQGGNPTGGGGGGGGGQAKAQPKSLRQREEEYVQARLRILGSTGDENDEEENSSPPSVEVGASKRDEGESSDKDALAAAAAEPPCGNAISRTPRGPDGTKGFNKNR